MKSLCVDSELESFPSPPNLWNLRNLWISFPLLIWGHVRPWPLDNHILHLTLSVW